jgi:hypothetical protein
MIKHFDNIIVVNFVCNPQNNEASTPIVMTAHNIKNGERWINHTNELKSAPKPPYPQGGDTLLISFYPSHQIKSYLALGWDLPEYVIDLYAEFRTLTNGHELASGGNTLMGALNYFGHCGLNVIKPKNISLLEAKGSLNQSEISTLTKYSKQITKWTEELFYSMRPNIDLPFAILRGRYSKVVAAVEMNGIPIDTKRLKSIKESWNEIKKDIINELHDTYDFYSYGSIDAKKLAVFLAQENIEFDPKANTNIEINSSTFIQLGTLTSKILRLIELHNFVFNTSPLVIPTCRNNRNKTPVIPFKSKTSRNQPSSNQFIYGLPAWARSLVKPKKGYGLAYIDWRAQEFGVAAALANDYKMKTAYKNDPYLSLAINYGDAPAGATKETHAAIRNQYKTVALAILYGMTSESLSIALNIHRFKAKNILQAQRKAYKTFTQWQESQLNNALLNKHVSTIFGWNLHIDDKPKPRSIINFPIQANAAEMLRVASIFSFDKGVKICALIHDAIVIEAPLDRLDTDIQIVQESMKEASRVILGGFELETDVSKVLSTDCYSDKKGRHVLNTINKYFTKMAEPRLNHAKPNNGNEVQSCLS